LTSNHDIDVNEYQIKPESSRNKKRLWMPRAFYYFLITCFMAGQNLQIPFGSACNEKNPVAKFQNKLISSASSIFGYGTNFSLSF